MTAKTQVGPIITSTGDIWEKYLHFGMRREYPAKHALLHPGEVTDTIYYIQSGEVLISYYASAESLNRLFILRGKSLLGLIAMFSPARTTVSWLTLEPCVCYLFSKKDVYGKLPRELLLNMLEQMGAMSSSMSRRFSSGATKSLDVRLARLLVHLVDACPSEKSKVGGSLFIAPRVTQEMAGELLGIHPVTMNKLLASFKAEGILGRFTKKKLEILDYDRLVAFAESDTR